MKRRTDPKVLAEGIDSDIHSMRSTLVSALAAARTLSQTSTSSTTPDTANVNRVLAEISQLISSSPSTPEKRVLLEKLNQLSRDTAPPSVNSTLRDSIPDADSPPVWFERVPRLAGPLIDIKALTETYSDDSSPSNGLESLLDGLFASMSSDSIYEAALRKLRDQVISLNNRNLALELNLDIAEREVRHWRSLYQVSPRHMPPTAPQSPMSPVRKMQSEGRTRKIEVEAWKHAVAKFIGSFDQFSMIRVLLHWQMHVREVRGQRNRTT